MSDGFEMIVDDHRSVERLLDRYFAAPDDGLAHEVCTELALHSEAEEAALYPHLRALAGAGAATGADLAERAEEEHAALGVLVARVLATPPADLAETMEHLAAQVRAHVEFEERQVLTALRPVVDGEELGRDLAEARDAVRARAGEPLY